MRNGKLDDLKSFLNSGASVNDQDEAGNTLLINAALYPNLKFNFVRDIAPVVLMTREPNAMVVHPSVPVKSLAVVASTS